MSALDKIKSFHETTAGPGSVKIGKVTLKPGVKPAAAPAPEKKPIKPTGKKPIGKAKTTGKKPVAKPAPKKESARVTALKEKYKEVVKQMQKLMETKKKIRAALEKAGVTFRGRKSVAK